MKIISHIQITPPQGPRGIAFDPVEDIFSVDFLAPPDPLPSPLFWLRNHF